MQSKFILWLLALTCVACAKDTVKDNSILKEHVGTWQLVFKSTSLKDSVTYDVMEGVKTIKIINGTHFSFFTHELPNNTDSLAAPVFVAGAGSYTLNGNVYKEFLEYCNFRKWENISFTFQLEVKGDSLIQSGVEEVKELNVSQTIVEKYIRIKL